MTRMVSVATVPRELLDTLKQAFETRLIDEVHRHNGIPFLPPSETALREAISALLIAVYPNDYEVVERT